MSCTEYLLNPVINTSGKEPVPVNCVNGLNAALIGSIVCIFLLLLTVLILTAACCHKTCKHRGYSQ